MTRLPHRRTAIQSSTRSLARSASPIEQAHWQERALNLGADELMSQAEWALRSRPRALRNVREAYTRFCGFLLGKIEQAPISGRQNRSKEAA